MRRFVSFESGSRLALLLSGICGFGLVACDDPKPVIDYNLQSVQPSPVTPGDTVIAYGVLPKQPSITVDGQAVTAADLPGGVRFQLPITTLAGNVPFQIAGDGASLKGLIAVNPRIDKVAINNGKVQVDGVGWSLLNVEKVQLNFAGIVLKPNIDSTSSTNTNLAPTLSASIPNGLNFGFYSVAVMVEDRTSNSLSVKREAGGVHGTVQLPASSNTAISRLNVRSTPLETRSKTSLIARAKTKNAWLSLNHLEFKNQIQRDAIEPLLAVRFEFSDTGSAQAAKTSLQTRDSNLTLGWEHQISTDGNQGLAVNRASIRQSRANSFPDQWYLGLLGMTNAWVHTKGQGVTVAVVDTGVDLEHPDLKANLLPGYDFVDGDSTPQDQDGHGTHVAGIVAANGKVSGVAPEVKLLPVRSLSGQQNGSAFNVAQGILWAAGLLTTPANPNPAKVINLSLGTPSYDALLVDAVNQALEHGVIVVAATGNDGGSIKYPAALPGVVSVTALAGPTTAYQPAYASKGLGLWLTAFGGDMSNDQDRNGTPDGILSTGLNGSYMLRNGTSMAAPQVAGLAALALANGTRADLVRGLLAGSANDLGVLGLDSQYGYGLANAKAITGIQPRMYVLAVDTTNTVLAWSPVTDTLEYSLGSLEPGQEVQLMAASDEDNDGIVGETGEFRSNLEPWNPKAGEVGLLNFTLQLSSATNGMVLPK
jgi:serine protease